MKLTRLGATMGFSAGGSGSLSSNSDVAFNAPITNNVLTYDATISKWRNAIIDPVVIGAEPVGLSQDTLSTLSDMVTAQIAASGSVDPSVAPVITTSTLSALNQSVAFSQKFLVTGDNPITWSIIAGTLPTGLSLAASTGVLSGTPSSSGAYSFTVQASNSAGVGTKAFSGTIVSAGTMPSITTTTLNSLKQGTAFSQTFSATGTPAITWSVSVGTLPAGLALATSTGVLSGTPSSSGAYSFTVQATNAYGSSTKALSGTIAAAGTAPSITTTALNSLTQGTAFSQSLTSNGSATITWSISTGTLPAGLSLSSTGILSGTPSGSGAYSFTAQAVNTYGSATKALSGTITAASSGGSGGIPTRVASFGPNGTHWPSATPWINASFVYDVSVAATWTAIQSAITAAPSSGNAIIRVQPGAMPVGLGSGSTDNAVLSGGPSSRTSKILIVPRDGYGTVTMNAASTIASKDSNGYSFTLSNVALMGFDFSHSGVVFRSCTNVSVGWSTFGQFNITANAGDTTGMECVETVLPDQIDLDDDHSAIRVANGYDVVDILFDGHYGAPSYKSTSSSAHCDSMQISAQGGGGTGAVTLRDSLIVQSSSQVMMLESTQSLALIHTALIGGLRATGRYPINSGRFTMTAQNTLWGGSGTTATAADSVIMGSISSGYSWDTVTNSFMGATSDGTAAASAGWQINSSYAGQSTLQTTWLNSNSPAPTPSYLASIWSAL